MNRGFQSSDMGRIPTAKGSPDLILCESHLEGVRQYPINVLSLTPLCPFRSGFPCVARDLHSNGTSRTISPGAVLPRWTAGALEDLAYLHE